MHVHAKNLYWHVLKNNILSRATSRGVKRLVFFFFVFHFSFFILGDWLCAATALHPVRKVTHSIRSKVLYTYIYIYVLHLFLFFIFLWLIVFPRILFHFHVPNVSSNVRHVVWIRLGILYVYGLYADNFFLFFFYLGSLNEKSNRGGMIAKQPFQTVFFAWNFYFAFLPWFSSMREKPRTTVFFISPPVSRHSTVQRYTCALFLSESINITYCRVKSGEYFF